MHNDNRAVVDRGDLLDKLLTAIPEREMVPVAHEASVSTGVAMGAMTHGPLP